jgi:hypothetical protein
MSIGSVAHQMKACRCYLGDDAPEEDESVSRRQGAKLAVEFFETQPPLQ